MFLCVVCHLYDAFFLTLLPTVIFHPGSKRFRMIGNAMPQASPVAAEAKRPFEVLKKVSHMAVGQNRMSTFLGMRKPFGMFTGVPGF